MLSSDVMLYLSLLLISNCDASDNSQDSIKFSDNAWFVSNVSNVLSDFWKVYTASSITLGTMFETVNCVKEESVIRPNSRIFNWLINK